jgi:hypothetical protein
VDVVDSGLKSDRPDARHAQDFTLLFVSEISAIHHPPIGLLNAVAVDRIVEKICKVGEEVQPVILAVRIRKELAA